MKSCTFAEFWDECKNDLTDSQRHGLTGASEYFKLNTGGYVGLDITAEEAGDSVWVSILVGSMADVWELRRILIEAGVSRVGFACRPGSVSAAFAKYYGCAVETSDQTYSDGGAKLRCVMYPQQTQRLRKSLHVSSRT